jgi:serine/threonine protein kinase/Tfp pilus assembly protein PilF
MTTPEPPTADDPTSAHTSALVDRLAEAMARQWHAGEYLSVEDCLVDHPELHDQPSAVLELLAEELTLGEEFGRPPNPMELRHRFPHLRHEVGVLLDCQQALSAQPETPRFPTAGEAVGGFRLLHELGRGAHGRVFLATQPALADRPVVLKLTPAAGREHLSLARLQHTHIVPLYSVHEFPERAVRGLCLPFFGGPTLAAVLDKLRDRPANRRTGRDLWDAIRQAVGGPDAAGPARRLLAAAYTEAVCWIGACLADALAYAQERGVLHLDVKPSNVLLTAEGQPMLLDFHLARAPLAAGEAAPPWLGGTPEYMAPEHAAAVAAVQSGRPVPSAVDGRADVYALGLVLAEALGGPPGTERFPTRSWRRANQHVSVGLADLLAKCLAPDPADRYPTAAALAADLRRHLADLPLRGVANRSPVERWRKWRRQRPLALPLAALLAVGVAVASGAAKHIRRQADQARSALQHGADYVRARRYAEALESLRAADVALDGGLTFHRELAVQVAAQRRGAELGLAAGELRDLCDRLRPLYGRVDLPERSARVIEASCRNVWARRDRLIRDVGEWPDIAPQVRADLLDLAVLWADLRARLGSRTAQREAFDTLTEAEHLLGASCVLAHEKQAVGTALGLANAIEFPGPPPQTAWEHYALGRTYLRAGDLPSAAAAMERAVELQPQAMWPNYYKGCCAFRAGQVEDAITSFSVCVALAPECAWCYFNRGLALAEHGRTDAARADFDTALRLDPGLAPAALHRGTLHLKAGRPAEAIADFRLALDRGADAGIVNYQSALAHLSRQDVAAARASLRSALESDPGHQPAKDLLTRLGPGDQ